MGRVILLLVLVVATSVAQDDVRDNNANAALVKRVEQLELELQALKAELADSKTERSKAAVSVDGAVPGPEQDKTEEQNQSPAQHRTDGLLSFGGVKTRIFGDVRFTGSDLKETKNSFQVNDLDFLFTGRLSDKITALSEITFELGEGGLTKTSARRALLQYVPSDRFKISAGQFQTAIGFYNTAYYHARWLATTADRPLLFQPSDEGGVLPTSLVGVTATGSIPSGVLGLSYLAEVGTSDLHRTSLVEENDVIEENKSNAFNVGLISRPTVLRGLQTGFSYYQANMSPTGLPGMRQTVMAAHIVYQTPRFEFLNEALDIRQSLNDGSGRVFHTPGAYSQISRQFHSVRPYFRYEYLRANDNNPLFSDVGRRNGPLVGLRYDFSEYAAFKAEYQRTDRDKQPSVNSGTVQVDFTF
jgi:hypothetical protein